MLVYTRFNPDALTIYEAIHILCDSFGSLYATPGNSYRDLTFASLQALDPGLAARSWTAWAISGGLLTGQTGDLAGALGTVFNPDLLMIEMGQNDVTAAVSNADFRTAVQLTMDYAITTMGVPIVPIAIPLQPGWTGATETRALEFNDILEEEAGLRGMPYVAGWERCLTTAGLSQASDVPLEATAADGYHPNNTGHQQLHDALWAELEPILYLGL